uniref:Angiomotin_C domain-containing protein n=1 Tax=Trichuris muris TaxID=70415 RepID=A0A5S6R3N0_TRIMR
MAEDLSGRAQLCLDLHNENLLRRWDVEDCISACLFPKRARKLIDECFKCWSEASSATACFERQAETLFRTRLECRQSSLGLMSSPIKNCHNQCDALSGDQHPPTRGHSSTSIVRVSSAHGARDQDADALSRIRAGSSLAMHAMPQGFHQPCMASRRSPEARAIQAVPPFGVREPVMPSNIPDECQVVKRLVREVVSGQLNPFPTTSAAASDTVNGSDCAPSAGAALAMASERQTLDIGQPPAYNSIFVKSLSPSAGVTSMQGDNHQASLMEKTSLSQPDVSRLPYSYLALSAQQKLLSSNVYTGSSVHLKPPTQQLEQMSQSLAVGQPSNHPLRQDSPLHGLRHHSAPPPSYAGPRDSDAATADEVVQQQQQQADVQLQKSVNCEADVSSRMITLVNEENRYLRLELEGYIKKTFKLQQLELQYQKIHREYEDLVRRQEKREQLEQQMRSRMQAEITRLKDINLHLQNQLESSLQQISYYQSEEVDDSELRHEITRRDMMIAQLITQNKELTAAKERHMIELEAQRETLEEQRSHIKILDKALSNAQERVLHAEDQLQKKEAYVQKSDELQRALHALQESMHKREENHKRVRADLEKKLAYLQIQKREHQPVASFSSRSLQDLENTIASLRKEIQEKEEQMLNLQSELVRWQEAYYVELKKQETAFSEASDTKDARIRVLEENSDKAEKLIETSQSETRRFLDDLRTAKGKINDLESRQQQLEALLAEKDAMINVLRRRQQATSDQDSSARSEDVPSSFSEVFSPLDNSKQRLEAVRRRLLQSPSPSWCQNRIYQRHNKFISMDSSFALDDLEKGCYTASLGRPVRSSRSALKATGEMYGTSTCFGGTAKHHQTARDMLTLPARMKAKESPVAVGRSRPRSADDHLLNADVLTGKEQTRNDWTSDWRTNENSSGSSDDKTVSPEESEEQLWNV